MPEGKVRKTGKKNRKWGRNKAKCALYRQVRWRKNKLRKLERHLSVHLSDQTAQKANVRLQRLVWKADGWVDVASA